MHSAKFEAEKDSEAIRSAGGCLARVQSGVLGGAFQGLQACKPDACLHQQCKVSDGLQVRTVSLSLVALPGLSTQWL